MVQLNASSLLWAKNSLIKQGDSDLFPRPFEIEAINNKWNLVREELLNKDMILKGHLLDKEKKYEWVGGRRAIIPKGRLSFRVATQLDPIDSLVLTSLIHQYGQRIENRRIPTSKNRVFSYRFKPDSDGHLYDENINWINFWEKSLEYAQQIPEGYVLISDISDFYNQVYHHTVEQELDLANVDTEIRVFIVDLLKKLTDKVSRGVPVGPHASHLIAEISLNSIDHLLEDSYHFCRYADDMHIFCETEQDAQIALFDLVYYLDQNGRLVLQKNKTKIMPSNEFCELARQKIEDVIKGELERKILDVIKRNSSGNPYVKIGYNSLTPAEKELFTLEKMQVLLSNYIDEEEPDYIRFRWLLRRLAQVGTPNATPFLMSNLENLMPAIEDICTYLISTENTYTGQWIHLGDDLIKSLDLPIVNHCEYLQMTILHLFSKIRDLNHIDKLKNIYGSTPSPMVKRKILNAATQAGDNYWLYTNKTDLDSSEPWVKRAIILGASTYTAEQKKFWLRTIIHDSNSTFLEKIIAEWVLSGCN
ncbi:RNA-directed DNA polymerase [Methanosarcina sp. T3]|uniref:RNA-directed DNA polymerase n=1 Tax=Methanosarcina sp. T3 TaxID=3439062 RepID=UPI003F82AB4C